MSLIRDAQVVLRELRAAHLAVDIVYRRGTTSASIKGTQASTTVTVDDGQHIGKSKISDWLIDVAMLSAFDKPQRGDQIDYEGVRYEVADIGTEHCWRWHGTDQLTFRIHTQHVPATETP